MGEDENKDKYINYHERESLLVVYLVQIRQIEECEFWVYDKSAIQAVIDEFQKSEIQSEAEVRSKFIVQLSRALGYPSELRGEEFPVYGYGGRDVLPAKNADFIFFTDREFGKYRKNTQKHKKWVQDHSLLIIEAKKTGEMPEDLGQAQFYTMWTKAIAYIETDGEDFKGYFLNTVSSDLQVMDAKVEELADKSELWNFSYENILFIKNTGVSCVDKRLIPTEEVYEIITEDDELDIPEDTLFYMRRCLGKNAEGLTNVQMVSRFLNTTENMLQNDMRYGIPSYMIDFPRHIYHAKLYIDDMIFPLICGEVIEFYWEDEARYFFQSDYIEALVLYKNDILKEFEIGYHILDRFVTERLNHFELVRKCLEADSVRIAVENEIGMQMSLPAGNPGEMWNSKQHVTSMFAFWLSGMKKLKMIEDYYEIEFKLRFVSDSDELNSLYEAIDFVYDGIMLNENCVITIPGNKSDEDIEITEPILFEENVAIPLQDRIIQGVVFRPYRSALLPCKAVFVDKDENDIVSIPGCCEYKIVDIAG